MQQTINNLMYSWEERLKSVIKNKGNKIEFFNLLLISFLCIKNVAKNTSTETVEIKIERCRRQIREKIKIIRKHLFVYISKSS